MQLVLLLDLPTDSGGVGVGSYGESHRGLSDHQRSTDFQSILPFQ